MNSIDILVAVESYPDLKENLSLTYAHTRNKYYKSNGFDVTVLNFSCGEDYVIDEIPVISLRSYRRSKRKYGLLLCHAANLKSHYFFLKKYGKRFDSFVFFFHGHEVLRVSKAYSEPYDYMKTNKVKEWLRDVYDAIKLLTWRKYYSRVACKSHFIFVSHWMYDQFLKWTKISPSIIEGRSSITYNCVGPLFEELKYDDISKKKYDFITIRSNLDGSKYAIDVVNRLAQGTPEAKFLVVGKGQFFCIKEKAKNITWVDEHLSADQIIEYLDEARFALMPTRTDAQGVMMCEMAAFGIPVITSDIPVCHEVFDGFNNTYFISNDKQTDLKEFVNKKSISVKDERFFKRNTIENEMNIICKIKER